MAATQVFSTQGYFYCIVDNVSSQTFPTLNANSGIGYDTVSVIPNFGAAAQQAAISTTGGTGALPDFVNKQTAIATGQVLVSLGYRNPS